MRSKMFYISKFCLLCLKEDDGSLEDVKNKDKSDVTIQEKLDYCVFELISSGHEFPGFICRECLGLLETLYIFKQQCFKSNRKIRNFMDSLKQMQFSALSYRDLSVPVQKLENMIPSANTNKSIKHTPQPIQKKESIKNTPKPIKKIEPIKKIKKSLINEFPKLNKSLNLLECELCLKQFSNKYLLKRHLSIHTDVKPYQCKVCFKTFYRKDSLKTHEQIHTKTEIKLDTPKLQQKFIKKNINKTKVKPGQKTYQCTICFTTISQKNNLKRHFIRCHLNSKENFNSSYNIIKATKEDPKLDNTVDLTSDELSDTETASSGVELVPFDDEVIVLQDEEQVYNETLQNTRKNKNQNVLNVINKLNNSMENVKKCSDANLECFVCQKSFSRNCKLSAHVGSHFGDTPYKL